MSFWICVADISDCLDTYRYTLGIRLRFLLYLYYNILSYFQIYLIYCLYLYILLSMVMDKMSAGTAISWYIVFVLLSYLPSYYPEDPLFMHFNIIWDSLGAFCISV